MNLATTGLSVCNHIMVIVYGPQGAGKSKAVHAAAKPFINLGLFLSSTVSQLTDERFQRVLADYYLYCADEIEWNTNNILTENWSMHIFCSVDFLWLPIQIQDCIESVAHELVSCL